MFLLRSAIFVSVEMQSAHVWCKWVLLLYIYKTCFYIFVYKLYFWENIVQLLLFFFVMFMYNLLILLVDVLFLFCVLFSQEKLQSSWFCIYACFEMNRIHVSWNEHVLIWQYLQGMCTLQAHDKLIKLLSFNKS